MNGNGRSATLANLAVHARDDLRDRVSVDVRRSYQMLAACWGLRADPFDSPFSEIGFGSYLHENGIHNFPAAEVLRPRWPRIVEGLELPIAEDGGKLLMPARLYWPDLVLPIRIVQDIRTSINEPMFIRYGWRPHEVNRRVYRDPDKAPRDSDHVFAAAVDVDFTSARGVTLAFSRVLQPMWDTGKFWLSIGHTATGRRRVHIGCLAPKTIERGRQRQWPYERDTPRERQQLRW